jgi:putative addiction module component (TIGR02574 family)
MNKPLQAVSADALQLSQDDQLRLVDQLLDHLAPIPNPVELAWREEILARVAAFESAPDETEDAFEAITQARQALKS